MAKPAGYWNEERCINEALKYNTRNEFQSGSSGAYEHARRKMILDQICSHMMTMGNRYLKHVYVYVFSDNHIYVGITGNIKSRNNDHMTKDVSPVFRHIKKTGLIPSIKYETANPVFVDIAIKMEKDVLNKYINLGFIKLNVAKTGGGISKNGKTIEEMKIESLKYKSRGEFAEKSRSTYYYALNKGLLDDICGHMTHRLWTYDKVKLEALKYKTRSEFESRSTAYYYAIKNGILDEVCRHMTSRFFTFESVALKALKYHNRTNFRDNDESAYNWARRNKVLDVVCAHMEISKFSIKKQKQ
jgi:predicted GIY-YIG superfamily endonuclease